MKEDDSARDNRNIKYLVFDVCKTILLKGDTVNTELIDDYIDNLTSDEVLELYKYSDGKYKYLVREITQRTVFHYADSFALGYDISVIHDLFEFDQPGNYNFYLEYFTQRYTTKHGATNLPNVFSYIFEYIKDASNHYKLFSRFYAIKADDIPVIIEEKVTDIIASVTDEIIESSTEKVNLSVQIAEHEANRAKEKAESAAKEAANASKEEAKKAVDNAVNEKMHMVTRQVTQTSVTILGMFAGIVLAFVTGLSYAASVMESVASANYFKLLSVASLIGLICYHLISLMFRFIIRIKEPTSSSLKWNKRDIVVTIILLALILIMGILQYIPAINDPLINTTICEHIS